MSTEADGWAEPDGKLTAALAGAGQDVSLAAIQSRAWANKLAKGFNVTDVPLEFGLLIEEVGEAFSAWRKERDHAGELADVLIFLVSIAEMTGVDLQRAVLDKMAVNEARVYRQMGNGTFVKENADV